VFFRVHIRLVSSFCALAGPRVRHTLERTLLAISLVSFGLFALMHHSYTGAYIDHTCFVGALHGPGPGSGHDYNPQFLTNGVADFTHIYLTDSISSYSTSAIHPSVLNASQVDTIEAGIVRTNLGFGAVSDSPSGAIPTPSYIYSSQKGFLVLPPASRRKYNISSSTFYLPRDSAEKCFHIPHMEAIKSIIPFHLVQQLYGFDTIILNLMRRLSNDEGFLYIEHRRKLIDLNYYSRFVFSVSTMNSFGNPILWDNVDVATSPSTEEVYHELSHNTSGQENERIISWKRIDEYKGRDPTSCPSQPQSHHPHYCHERRTEHSFRDKLVLKLCILITATFLFFAMTSMVSFILKQTQSRMLKFTFLLQYHVRNQIPYSSLVFVHVFESLIFVPIMLGVLFFLFEIFADKLFSFMLISLVWISEVYSVMSLRTYFSIHYFPKILFLYFLLLHMYVFSCPFGFTYGAFFTLVFFELHLFLFFLNRFEIPAYANGNISALRPRYFYTTNAPAPPVPAPVTHMNSPAGAPPAPQLDVLPSTTPIVGTPPAVLDSSTNAVWRPSGSMFIPPRPPPRNFSAASFASCQTIESNSNSILSSRTRRRPSTTNSEGTAILRGDAENSGLRREQSFSTPLEEIIAYEHALQRQQAHLDTQDESTASMYDNMLPHNVHPSSDNLALEGGHSGGRNISVSSLTGSYTCNRQSFYSDTETIGDRDRDIGMALFGSDSGEVMSETGGLSRSQSFSDFQDSTSSELGNVSKDLQFMLSKQIQNQQMAAMMVFDLPVAPSPSPSQTNVHVTQQTTSQKESTNEGEVASDVKCGVNNKIEGRDVKAAPIAAKRSSVFSMFSNLKWGKSKATCDSASIRSANTTATSSSLSSNHIDEVSVERDLSHRVDSIDEKELQSDSSDDSRGSSTQLGVMQSRLLDQRTISQTHSNAAGPIRECISLSSPLANSALESLQPRSAMPPAPVPVITLTGHRTQRATTIGNDNHIGISMSLNSPGRRERSTSFPDAAGSTTQPLHAPGLNPLADEDYVKETEGFSIFGVYDDAGY